MFQRYRRYFSDISFLLGADKRRLPLLFGFFILVSLLDLVGIGLVGSYIILVTDSSGLQANAVTQLISRLEFISSGQIIVAASGLVLILIFVLKALVAAFVNRAIIQFSHQQLLRLRLRTMDGIQKLQYLEVLKENNAYYVQMINSFVSQYAKSLMSLLRLTSEGIVALSIFFFLATVNWQALLGLLLLGSVIFFIYNKVFQRRVSQAGRDANVGGRYSTQAVLEGLAGFKEIRILGKEEFFFNRVKKGTERFVTASAYKTLVTILPKFIVDAALITFVVFLVVIIRFQSDSAEVLYPIVGMFGMAALRTAPIANLFISNVLNLRYQRNAVTLLSDALRKFPENSSFAGKPIIRSELTERLVTLELVDVMFSYPGTEQRAINEVSLSLKKGDSVGLIGASGSGKTTLVNIILGLFEPQAGQVLFNGKSLGGALSAWRSQVAYLPQDVFLMDDSLASNIALGVTKEHIDQRNLNKSLQQAKLGKFIEELPCGVETVLGERGVRLSGGQKQRVALARSFYHGRDVLVLDEATSALDSETEREVVDEIKQLKGQKTMIVIAHRLSTLEHCDRIYRLDGGRITQITSYNEVKKNIPQVS